MFHSFIRSLAFGGLLFLAGTGAAFHAACADPNADSRKLSSEMAGRLMRVEEFRFIRAEAEKLGIRAWLFGGTAAGYGHYVKWDLEREGGDASFQPDRFDYDYTNIYRSTQDLDIVVDAPPEKAQALQAALAAKYPHMQGSKTAWEVRLLRQDMGDKQALLNNPDFLNQHTDSNSTGMIELTKPAAGDAVIRDIRDWNSPDPAFLRDIRDGELHYYFSPLHETTKFFKEGRNPPILSAIRYLTKAVQYELKIRPEDREHLEKIIRDFDPKSDTQNSYVATWIEKNGKKLIQNAVNIEYAVNLLDELGLRKKLAAIKGNTNAIDSLAWWMEKEPLRSKPVGLGTGRTAAELGIDTVAHETRTFPAYESITRAPTGDPNVLISRDGVFGEGAAYGNGFYTRIGRAGASGGGLTIRFQLRPDAREGKDADFTLAAGDYVVIHNKNAIRVIPESLNFNLLQFLQYLKDSGVDGSDQGLIEKLRRRIFSKANTIAPADRKKVLQIGLKEAAAKSPNLALLQEWVRIPFVDEAKTQFFRTLLSNGGPERLAMAALLQLRPDGTKILSQSAEQAARRILGVKLAYDDKTREWETLINELDSQSPELSLPIREEARKAIETNLEARLDEKRSGFPGNLSYFQRHSRTESDSAKRLWAMFDRSVERMLSFGASDSVVTKWIESPSSVERPDIMERALLFKDKPPEAFLYSGHWARTGLYKKTLQKFFDIDALNYVHVRFLNSPAALANPELRQKVVDRMLRVLGDPKGLAGQLAELRSIPQEKVPAEVLDALFEKMKTDPELSRKFFSDFTATNNVYWKPNDPRVKRWLEWVSDTKGEGLSLEMLDFVLSQSSLNSGVKDIGPVLADSVRRSFRSGQNPASLVKSLDTGAFLKSPGAFDVLLEFLNHDWNGQTVTEVQVAWAQNWLTSWAWGKEDQARTPELVPGIIRMLDAVSNPNSARPQAQKLAMTLKDKEPFRSDPRLQEWLTALSQPHGQRGAFLGSQNIKSCASSFRELSH